MREGIIICVIDVLYISGVLFSCFFLSSSSLPVMVAIIIINIVIMTIDTVRLLGIIKNLFLIIIYSFFFIHYEIALVISYA